MSNNLYINACVRGESRTHRLAQYLIAKLQEPFEEVALAKMTFPAVDQDFLDMRDGLVGRGDFDAECFAPARQFAAAEAIVIAAPYWDLSFPAVLKQYFEQINVLGVTFRYSPEGIPIGLCRAKALYYVTTAGGRIVSDAYGFGYVRALAENFYHIPEVRTVQAEGLDIQGAEVRDILRRAEAVIDGMLDRR